MTKGVHINVNVQYKALPGANVANVIQVFESTTWANFMVTYVGPHLKAYTPASTTILAQLPSWQAAPTDDACVICMSPMDDDRIALPCQHAFHHACIREWLSRRNTAACDVVVRVQAERLSGPASPQKTRKRSLSASDAAAALKRLRTG
ncbi:hypothetical protein SPRG_19519 [Saprolegnia parasitica CBS 223.65]|uniref:RING-type domain-containing protein n=1 Tax=Saprolegnia parasitica (strain CBS 223.65) TaxID=695850 RepID=A0A067CR57_SAPPC|nr:hypothetical protein SPRG_19519 [Saprolegnia parasitica CBS 223.65]KDO31700.1 hypothetical protein SPRG_19519 [Saprolegnia parasitica CBS 223.65]|eukprot:XP_012197770.1 hypothetical protein SPRG_19519 [Saprolegnia parasitica CBS 223.65]